MVRPLKLILVLIAALVLLLIIGALSFSLLFEPNNYRDEIAAEVQRTTGRELLIEGDLEMSLFPWLAINVGKSRLGNAEGFGDEPFASFEQARLSVRLLPMLLQREFKVSTAALDSLQLNLAVNRNGRSNWQDFIDASDAAADEGSAEGSSATLDIASIEIRDANVSYSDAQSGDTYRLTNLNMTSGRVSPGDPVPLSGTLQFELQPAGLSGDIEFETVATFDTDASTVSFDKLSVEGLLEGVADVPTTLVFETTSLVADTEQEIVTLGEVEMSLLGVDIAAEVEPISYTDEILPAATIQVDAFSLRGLMQRMNIEVPETADPNALGKVIIDARATVGSNAIALSNVKLVLDETNFSGDLSIPRDENGTYRFDLAADSIDLDRYMEPVNESASAGSGGTEAPVEIPSDLIRLFNARGTLTVNEARLGGLKFENVTLGLNNAGGKLRLHPITATLFEGTYNGDVGIDASGSTAVLSVNEQVAGVQLASLAAAMFEKANVSGTISGTFKLTGRGNDLGAIQRSLSGDMTFALADGAWEGTDVWYELRRARALFKQQPAPEPELPARTRFSEVKATGPVSDGVFRNDDLFAELPFMQITGNGTVDLAAATIDYRLTARVLEKPEFVQEATAEELEEFTEAVIPLRISGPLAEPSIKPDIEAMLKERVKDEIKDRLFDKLLGGKKKQPDEEVGDEAANAEGEKEEEKDIEDKLKDSLRDLLKR